MHALRGTLQLQLRRDAARSGEDAMKPDQRQTIDEVVNDIDDLNTTVEELRDQAERPEERESLDRLKSMLDKASEAGDDLEDQNE